MGIYSRIRRSYKKIVLFFIVTFIGSFCISHRFSGQDSIQSLTQMKNQLRNYQDFVRNLKSELISLKNFENSWSWIQQYAKTKTKVIVWGYFRGGSSFLYQLASAKKNTTTFYEPLWLYEQKKLNESRGEYITKLFDCDEEILNMYYHSYSHTIPLKVKSYEQCKKSNLRVAKINRLYGSEDLEWLIENSNIKVIHALRDPRAIYGSRRQFLDMKKESSPQQICRKISEDIQALNKLPPDRYVQIRLEEVIQEPVKATQDLYKFMGENLDEDVMKFLNVHISETPKELRNERLSTFKNPKDLNDIFKIMPVLYIKKVDAVCKDLISALDYEPMGDITTEHWDFIHV